VFFSLLTVAMCSTEFCAECQTAWHTGKSCEAFKMETSGDKQLLKLARRKRWRKCPNCKSMIEKQFGDCNFVTCRCSSKFCFRCGVEYKSVVATANNHHGKAGCDCGLWTNEVEDLESSDSDENDEEVKDILASANPRPGAAAHFPARDVSLAGEGPNVVVNRRAELMRCLHPQQQKNDRMPMPSFYDPVPAAQEQAPGLKVDVDKLIMDVNSRIRTLPYRILGDLTENRCPYGICGLVFVNSRSLSEHLAATNAHDVYICCGRPFDSERSLQQHRTDSSRQHY
jgi:hypothetical protein